MCQFVPNFRGYVSAKYDWNWFTVGKDITEIKRVNFLLRHSVEYHIWEETWNWNYGHVRKYINVYHRRLIAVISQILLQLWKVKNRYIWLPHLGLTPPTRGFPWDNLHKILIRRSRMAKVPHGIETLRKISITWVGCTNVTDERQTRDRQMTDGRPMTYSEREHNINITSSEENLTSYIEVINVSCTDTLLLNTYVLSCITRIDITDDQIITVIIRLWYWKSAVVTEAPKHHTVEIDIILNALLCSAVLPVHIICDIWLTSQDDRLSNICCVLWVNDNPYSHVWKHSIHHSHATSASVVNNNEYWC